MSQLPLVIVRPQPGADATARRALAIGLSPIVCPLFEIAAIEWMAPEPGQFDALMLTSANAARGAGLSLDRYRRMPVYVVGEESADAARAGGLAPYFVGDGGATALANRIALDGHRKVLWLCGRDRVEIAVPPILSITSVAVYESRERPASAELVARLADEAIVALHSVRAANAFARIAVDRDTIAIAALSPAVATAAGEGWRIVAAAANPTDAALLALAAQLCQKLGPNPITRARPQGPNDDTRS